MDTPDKCEHETAELICPMCGGRTDPNAPEADAIRRDVQRAGTLWPIGYIVVAAGMILRFLAPEWAPIGYVLMGAGAATTLWARVYVDAYG